MKLSEIARRLNGQLHGADIHVGSFSSDTREVQLGDCFIALKGPRFDANLLLGLAHERGAIAAVVSQVDESLPMPQVVVPDTFIALGQLAKCWREQFDIVAMALTGSAGKTTTKDMLASICAVKGVTLATSGNKNNEIGVPLTMLRLRSLHQFGVFELGANHSGEIAYTSALVQPRIVAITNIGKAHLEGFGSREGIARAKCEIYAGMPADGIGVVNLDDDYAPFCREQLGHREAWTVSCKDSSADYFADHIQELEDGCYVFDLRHRGQMLVTIRLQVLGLHNVANALIAAAMAQAAGISVDAIKTGLESLTAPKRRLNVHRLGELTVIDDTYNANPISMKAAIDVLTSMPGRRIFVCGDMGELGAETEAGHREVGEWAKMKKVDALYAVGQYASFTAEGFGSVARQYPDQSQLIRDLGDELRGVVSILVKGSRSAHMEDVVEALLKTQEQQ